MRIYRDRLYLVVLLCIILHSLCSSQGSYNVGSFPSKNTLHYIVFICKVLAGIVEILNLVSKRIIRECITIFHVCYYEYNTGVIATSYPIGYFYFFNKTIKIQKEENYITDHYCNIKY